MARDWTPPLSLNCHTSLVGQLDADFGKATFLCFRKDFFPKKRRAKKKV